MNKLRIFGIILFIISAMTVAQAQSYNKLWKQVEELEKKDLPKSVIAGAKKIYEKAKDDKNVPQMMKAYLTMMTYRKEISLDSLDTDLKYLEQWVDDAALSVGDRAVLCSLLGELTIRKNPEDGIKWLDESLKDSLILMKQQASDWAPLVVEGETSRRYFNDNLYDLLVRRAVGLWHRNLRGVWRKKIPEIQQRAYQPLLNFYQQQGNRSAWLLTALDAAEPDGAKEEQLRAWIQEYGDVEVCAEVYRKLGGIVGVLKKNPAEQLALLREAIKRYPHYERVNMLKNIEQEILAPGLSFRVDAASVYPGKEMDIKIQHKNLSGFTLRMYKLEGFDGADEPDVNLENVKDYGKIVREEHFDLSPTPHYKPADTILSIKAPAVGIYYWVAVPDVSASPIGELVRITQLKLITRQMKAVSRSWIVDKETGHRVEDALLCRYENEGGHWVCKDTIRPGKAGFFSYKFPKKDENVYYRAITPEDKAMGVSSFWMYGYKVKKDTKRKNNVLLYTDRSIYRPGQTVYFSGISYDQRDDTTTVADGKYLTIALKCNSANDVPVEKGVTTDEYGVFSGEFVLPVDAETGRYQLRTEGAMTHFQVEEYKRPTFDVTFNSVKEAYQPGDSIRMTGVARTFAGMPVANATVAYRIQKEKYVRWTGSGWSHYDVKGTAVTDKEGKFTVPVVFEKEEQTQNWYWTYKVSADVTNMAGETQSGRLELPIANSSLMIQLDVKENQLKFNRHSQWEFKVTNLKNEKREVEVTYKVYKWDEKTESEKEVYSNKVGSNQRFMPIDLYRKFPSGEYMLKAQVMDEQGRICKDSTTFVMFSLGDKKSPVEATEWSYQSSHVFDGDKPVFIVVGSNEKDVQMFIHMEYGKMSRFREVHFSDSLLIFPIRYEEKFGDGVIFSYVFVKRGKVYQKKFDIKKKNPEKELRLKWKTFRDRLCPGQQETWTLQVSKGNQPVHASLLAAMYDASLDKFALHSWHPRLYYNRFIPAYYWWANDRTKNLSWRFYFPINRLDFPDLTYSLLGLPSAKRKLYVRGTNASYNGVSRTDVTGSVSTVNDIPPRLEENAVLFTEEILLEDEAMAVRQQRLPHLRTNFNETAFFYPKLRTDANGEVKIEFTLPESLTTWKFMGLAHTKDMDYGTITSQVVANKEFMLQPNLPRFVRIGDEVSLPATLMNLTDKDISTTVTLELFNPVDEKVIFTKKQRILVTARSSAAVNFGFEVKDMPETLGVRMVADGGDFSDGEQRAIPVLGNKQTIVETVPLYINGKGSSTFSLDELFNHHSATVTDPQMTVEFAANPAWYAIQALPGIVQPDGEDAISAAVALYASVVSDHLLQTNPKLADKLDMDTLNARIAKATARLKRLQNEEGAWSWFKGMGGSVFVTTQVAETLIRMYGLHPFYANEDTKMMYQKAVAFLLKQAEKEYARIKERPADAPKVLPSEFMLHYLYICALNDVDEWDMPNNDEFIELLVEAENLGDLTIYGKACCAIVLQKAGKTDKAKELMRSLMEYSVYTEEMGRYFDTPKALYSWRSYKIPTEVMAIEALQEVMADKVAVDEMKRWLLKQKQTQRWNTPIATADAVYALLKDNKQLLSNNGGVTLRLGETAIHTSKDDTLGYVKQDIPGKVTDIRKVTVEKTFDGIGWGAVYAEYLEDMDKIGVQGDALTIRKEIYKDGKPLDASGRLKVGDKLTVCLTVKSDRDMDFIEVKDERAACMEPVDVLSGYRWKDGLGYYQRTKDSSTSFFIEQMRKGTYVLQYDVYINLAGSYQEGAATVRSVYAPEFGGHVGGRKVVVE